MDKLIEDLKKENEKFNRIDRMIDVGVLLAWLMIAFFFIVNI